MNSSSELELTTPQLLMLLAWEWRVELTFVGVIALVYWAFACVAGYVGAALIVGAAIGLVLSSPRCRQYFARVLSRARWRRRLTRALTSIGSPSIARVPKIVRVDKVLVGVRLTLIMRSGTAAHELDRLRPYLETHFGARYVRIAVDPGKASLVRLTIARNDPFHIDQVLWPRASIQDASVWTSLPIGIDEEGEEIRIGLIERNLLCGGEPGSGKSGLLNALLVSLALDPTVDLYLFDPKEVELAPFAAVARCCIGNDLDAANDQLRMLINLMDQRFAVMRELGIRKFERHHGYGVIVVVIDELPLYVANSDTKGAKEFANNLRDLLSRGRAASIVVIAAAQKPSADTVPSSIRDLIGLRSAFRCSTREASDTILGGGWATQGYSSTSIPISQRGVCLLLDQDGVPKLMKTYWVSDSTREAIVNEARKRRSIDVADKPGDLDSGGDAEVDSCK